MVASQKLEAGDVLRRFKEQVSQAEPLRGNKTNLHARPASARCLGIVTVYGILLTCVGVFIFFDSTCMCICVCISVILLFLRCFVYLCKAK